MTKLKEYTLVCVTCGAVCECDSALDAEESGWFVGDVTQCPPCIDAADDGDE